MPGMNLLFELNVLHFMDLNPNYDFSMLPAFQYDFNGMMYVLFWISQCCHL